MDTEVWMKGSRKGIRALKLRRKERATGNKVKIHPLWGTLTPSGLAARSPSVKRQRCLC